MRGVSRQGGCGTADRRGDVVVSSEAPAQPAEWRVALVSGGNRGLGLQLVRRLALLGMRVVLGSRLLADGHAAIDRLGDMADRVAVRQLDITDADSVARLVGWMTHRLGRCDVLVNNAAVLMEEDDGGSSTDVPLDVVRRTMETNLLGTWRLTQAIVPLMRARRYGRIVNISSDLGSLASMRRGFPAYRASKTAVNALTRMLADELAHDGILVNSCSPEPLWPDGGEGVAALRLSASSRAPLWLATLPDDGPTGGFYRDHQSVDW